MVPSSSSFARQQVQGWEQENPHEIDEMPVQAGDFDAIGESFGDRSATSCFRVPRDSC